MVGGRRRRMLGQALDHGRRPEQRYPAIPGKQLEDLGRIEAAARRDHLAGGFGRVRQDIAPRAVGHRRRVQNGVAGRDLVDVREVRQRHRQQIAMAQHRALGLARGAARVEQPGDVVRRHLRDRRRIAGEQGAVLGAADLDDALQTLDAVLERRDRLAQIRSDEADARARVVEDVFQLARVQLGVRRDHGEPRVPAGEQQLDVLRHVFHHERDAVARGQIERRAQAPRQHRAALRELAVAQQHVRPERHRRQLGVRPPRAHEQIREVHRPHPSVASGALQARLSQRRLRANRSLRRRSSPVLGRVGRRFDFRSSPGAARGFSRVRRRAKARSGSRLKRLASSGDRSRGNSSQAWATSAASSWPTNHTRTVPSRRPAHDARAIWRERRRIDRCLMAAQDQQLRPARRIPHPHRPVTRSAHDPWPSGENAAA